VDVMRRLYQREGAGRPARVRWAFEEAGAPYDWIVMNKEEAGGDEHARRHPLGRVPALETDDGTLFESAALCLHIADQHPETGLIPALGTHARGEVYQWAFFAMTEIEGAMVRAYIAHRGDDAEATAKADAQLEKAASVVADRLDGRAYIVGDRFTIADVVVGGVLHTSRRIDLLPDDARLRAYLENLDSRPAKQKAYSA
jgi:glutathione S-transferase